VHPGDDPDASVVGVGLQREASDLSASVGTGFQMTRDATESVASNCAAMSRECRSTWLMTSRP
jgi:hypothetical protein